MPRDYMYCTYIAGAITVFTAPEAHQLATGDLIYVETGELYNEQGYPIILLSATTFAINVANTGGGLSYVFFLHPNVFKYICRLFV